MKKSKKIFFISLFIMIMIMFLSACGSSQSNVDQKKVRQELNAYIEKITEDGTLKEMQNFWYDQADTGKSFDFSKLDAKNGTIRFGTRTSKPFSFLKDNEWTGFTIEIIYKFCQEKGYAIKIQDFGDNNALVLATSTGKCDVGGSNLSITDERKKSVDYSPVYYHNRIAIAINQVNHDKYKTLKDFDGALIGTLTGSAVPTIAVNKIPNFNHQEYNNLSDGCLALSQGKIEGLSADEILLQYAMKEYPNLELTCPLDETDVFGFIYAKENGGNTFLSSIIASFNSTFIEENRWLLIAKGVGNTLLITFTSIILGSALGFGVFLLCRKEGKIANTITKWCQWIIDGLPAVVFLMILYYVILGNINLNNVLVSIIAFTLIFASSVVSMVKTAVSGVDMIQYEVSYALGYSENQTFFKMILPQALHLLWTPYQGAVKRQIKATAIVGYIASLDLTKAGDMIRSSTFEAFFPLLTVAVLYFFLGWLLSKLVDAIRVNTEPSRKKSERFLKGVKIHD